MVIRRVCNVGNGLKKPDARDSPIVIKCSTTSKKKTATGKRKDKRVRVIHY